MIGMVPETVVGNTFLGLNERYDDFSPTDRDSGADGAILIGCRTRRFRPTILEGTGGYLC